MVHFSSSLLCLALYEALQCLLRFYLQSVSLYLYLLACESIYLNEIRMVYNTNTPTNTHRAQELEQASTTSINRCLAYGPSQLQLLQYCAEAGELRISMRGCNYAGGYAQQAEFLPIMYHVICTRSAAITKHDSHALFFVPRRLAREAAVPGHPAVPQGQLCEGVSRVSEETVALICTGVNSVCRHTHRKHRHVRKCACSFSCCPLPLQV